MGEVVKMLHHLVGGGLLPLAAKSASATAWEPHWVLSTSSLLRFAYTKWVNVPQDAKGKPDGSEANVVIEPADPQLRPHHAFLFKHNVATFEASGAYELELTENSVLFSEAFAFASFCRLHGVTTIFESGVYKGVSSELWSLLAAEVAGVDIFLTEEAKARLAKRPNVRLMEGDGRVLLPQLLDERPDQRVAVFIDGPKGELAIHLALSLRELPQVAFVAIHDMEPYRQELSKFGAFFFSDETWFQEEYGYLDKPFRENNIPAGGTMAFLQAPR